MTKSRIITALAAALLLSALAGPNVGAAERLMPAVIAVVDTQLLLKNSAAGKDIARQVEEIRAKYQAEIDRRQEALRTEEQEIRRQSTILAPAALAEKQRVFRGKIAAVQQYVQQTSQMVDQSVAKSMGEVQRSIFNILGEMKDEYGFNFVLDKSQILFGLKALDLSSQVLAKLDQRLSKVTVQLPAQ